ncbi:MAG TPA: heme-binding beta-barrel domain-containing protein [Rhizomicrobium sp.]|nr:heme-binding beta-barrel domain-containing protein [Rhizomicrobium sp.]
MNSFPEDIFTEQEDVDPDTLANLGPLRRLAGIWESAKGVDLNPKAAGPERRNYIERIEMQPIDPQANGPQLLYGLRYHAHINTPEEDITFHDQVGYWLWERETGLVMQSLTIPRGQTALSVGHAKPGDNTIVVSAARGQTNYGICSTDFLEYAFRTDSFRLEITFNPDGSWSYVSDTMLKVRGQNELFRHRDVNTLVKIAEPTPNPLFLIAQSRK